MLGAITSRTMIQTLANKVLKEAEAARQKISKLENVVIPIRENIDLLVNYNNAYKDNKRFLQIYNIADFKGFLQPR